MPLNVTNRSEFDRLVEPHRRALQAHCYRMMGSLFDAEDMVQETFLKAWRNRESLAVQASLRPWLYKIATNVCLDTLRGRRRRVVPTMRGSTSAPDEPIPPPMPEHVWLEPYPDSLLSAGDDAADPTSIERHGAPNGDPFEHVAAKHNITMAFIAALHLLPPRQRAVLILRDVMDWQTEEVATLLDTTVSAVKSALHRARATLAERGYTPDSMDGAVLHPGAQAQLNAYVRAWEAADIETLTSLLRDDATFSMPPVPTWYQGRHIIGDLFARTIFSGQAASRWHLRPTRANGQQAFGLYRVTGTPGRYAAYGIQVLRFDGPAIADITTFLEPRLFGYFDLPPLVEGADLAVSGG
jgi:RNA polymerase sigma-70 factor (ECF subfamily)